MNANADDSKVHGSRVPPQAFAIFEALERGECPPELKRTTERTRGEDADQRRHTRETKSAQRIDELRRHFGPFLRPGLDRLGDYIASRR